MNQLRAIGESRVVDLDQHLIENLKASGVVVVNDKFEQVYDSLGKVDLMIFIGGRGGSKTYEGSRLVTALSCASKKRTVVLRDEKAHVKESILNEILERYTDMDPYWRFSDTTVKLENGIKDKETGQMLVFTKGFRASSKDKKAGLKSLSDIDIALIEEMEDLRDEDQFNTFSDSIRKAGALIILILNTPDVNHWLIKRYFNLVIEDDGYFDVHPKNIPGVLVIKTGYEDNKHLPEHIRIRYNAYGDPDSHLYNPHYFKTAIKGWASTGRKGQILTKVKPISQADYLALPSKEIYGQDFGTASPAGLLGVKFDKSRMYMRQLSYEPKDTKSLGKLYCTLRFTDRDEIIADGAEPETIKKLKDGWDRSELTPDEIAMYPQLLKGFYMTTAKKGPGSIKAGIGILQSMQLFAVEESKDLWNEIYNWIYAVDKNMNPTDEPVDDFNHLLDPARYIALEHQPASNIRNQSGFFR